MNALPEIRASAGSNQALGHADRSYEQRNPIPTPHQHYQGEAQRSNEIRVFDAMCWLVWSRDCVAPSHTRIQLVWYLGVTITCCSLPHLRIVLHGVA